MLYKKINPHGGDIYGRDIRLDFSANTNPMGMPPEVKKEAVKSLEVCDRYPDPYARELTAAISAYHGIPEDYILCGAGAAELIYNYASAGKFAKALVMAPTFLEYELALRRSGTDVMHLDLKEEDGFILDDSIFRTLDNNRINALFICNPNNPTGKLADPELMSEILDYTEKAGIRLFLDECFIELAEGRSMIPELKSHPELIILRAFTKNYGMAGLRLGYVLSSDSEFLRNMSKLTQPWNISTPAQAAGVQALKEKDFIRKSIELIKEERAHLKKGLTELGLKVIDSDVNYLLFRGPEDLYDKMLQEGILIRNCDNYRGLCAGWYRIAVRLPEENDELLRTMAKVLGKEI